MNGFAFIDETGVLQGSSSQRFFALGLLKCFDTSKLGEVLFKLKSQAESHLFAQRASNCSKKRTPFEFKFSSMTKETVVFYRRIVELFFISPENYFCCLVLDKANPMIDITKYFPNAWEAYISFSRLLIQNNIKRGESLCILADFLGKPKASEKYYEAEMRKIPDVSNATFLESHASLFIQFVDVLVGSVVNDFRRKREGNKPFDQVKASVSDLLREKLGVDSLSQNLSRHNPYFSIWEFQPK